MGGTTHVVDTRFKLFVKGIGKARPYEPGEDLVSFKISVNETDKEKGSPKIGDYIGQNMTDPADMWLIERDYFAANYKPMPESAT